MEVVATRGFDFLHNQRTKTLRWVKERARRLDPEEHKLKKSMHPGIAGILKDKKLLLFKELWRVSKFSQKEGARRRSLDT